MRHTKVLSDLRDRLLLPLPEFLCILLKRFVQAIASACKTVLTDISKLQPPKALNKSLLSVSNFSLLFDLDFLIANTRRQA